MIDIEAACLRVDEHQRQMREEAARGWLRSQSAIPLATRWRLFSALALRRWADRLEPAWPDTPAGSLGAHPLVDVYQAMLLLDRPAPG
ncbi:MAG: hypothetical protein PVSMB9_02070 [Candidatus Dormibacteria bacterium]